MFEPHYDPQALQHVVDDVDLILYRVDRILILPKYEMWFQREAFVRTAYSSTIIENPAIPEEEMEAAARPSPSAAIPAARQDVANYARALEFVEFVAESGDIPVDEAVIREIHWHLMKGIDDRRVRPGQYRTEPNWIEDQGVRVYEPPFHMDVPPLMREFSLWIRDDDVTHPLYKAGIAHAHLAAIHPFVDGNGRTARLLVTLLLQRQGYGFRKLLSLDSFYQRNKDLYIDGLKKSIGERFAPDYDLTRWLDFFLLSLKARAENLENEMTRWRQFLDRAHRELSGLGMSERQTDGLVYAMRTGRMMRKDYMEITGVSAVTASRDLQDLVEKGVLVARGYGRSRYYIPTPGTR